MSKRFEYGFDALMCSRSIYDTKSGVEYEESELRDIVDILNQQQERIAELEEQLKNAIVPKFNVGQNVWTIRHNNYIYNTRIDEIKVVGIDGKNEIFYYYDQPGSYAHCEEMEDNLFATKKEAQAKLEELKGERK